jgi:hypothetical protein
MAPIKVKITCVGCNSEREVWNHSSCMYCSNVCAANHKYSLWLEDWLNDAASGSSGSKTNGCTKRVKRYFNENIYHCESCGIGREWKKRPLTLEINHIDGDRKNNKRSNLELICPNCHSQTPNFRAKNIKKVP